MLRIHWLLQLSQRWFHQHGRTRRRSSRRVSLMRRRILPSLEVLEDRLAPAVFNVTTTADTNAVNLTTGTDANGQVSLRSALEAANNLGGSNTINLSAADYQLNLGSLNIDNNLTIEGAAPQETVDGPVPTTTIDAQKLSQIFTVSASQVVFLTNLSLDNGQTSAQGGSIYNAGDLTLTGDNIGGEVLGTPGSDAEGGAIFNAASGSLHVVNTALYGIAQGGDGSAGVNGSEGSNGTNGGNGGQGLGGSIYNDGGNVYISDGGVPSISGSGGLNGIALGGSGGQGGNGDAQGSLANGNGGNGGAGGEAAGGGIYNTSGGVVIISSGSIISSAYGGSGGGGGVGGTPQGGANGGAAGDGGAGGAAMGGGIFNSDGTILLVGSGSSEVGISSNSEGGDGGVGGEGGAGGRVHEGMGGNGGKGGQGGVGGDGLGGGLYNDSGAIAITNTSFYAPSQAIQNVTVHFGRAVGGMGGAGGDGGIGGNSTAYGNGLGAAASAGNGSAAGVSAGGGIYNVSGTLGIIDSQMMGGYAEARGSSGAGGSGALGNSPSKGGNGAPGSNAFGGAIYTGGGNVDIEQSLLVFNQANGTAGGHGGNGLYVSTIGAVAGPGGVGGEGAGGGIAIFGGAVTLNNCTLAGNQAKGGAGGQGGSPEGGKDDIAGAGGAGGNGLGGDINLNGGTLTVTNCTFANGNNLTQFPPQSAAIGGNGGNGGSANNGSANGGKGGNGGDGGDGLGGALYASAGTLDLLSSTISGLQAQQGTGGSGGIAPAASGTPGSVGASGSGMGGGIDVADGATVNVFNSLIASNTANNVASTDVSGTFTSLGHNLIGNASGATGFGALGDLLGTSANPINPQLGPLTANGGGTAAVPLYTLALQAGSPAIDAPNLPNTPAVSAYDERGVPRDSQSDIGAYEYSSTNNTNGVADVPSLSSPGFQTASANVSNSFNLGSFSDNAPPLSAWKISVDWGDQSSLTTFSVTTTGSLPTQSHTYASAGDYLVAETIVNEQGAVDTAYFVVEVGSPTSAVPANIVATAGNAQTVAPGSTLGTNLQATVTDSSGNPISGVSVIFTAPSSGASGSFAGGVTSVTETTNAEGVATAPAFTANSTTGGYTVTASVSGVATPANFNLVNDVPVTLSALSVPASTQGVAYNQTLTASGGTGSLTVTYKVTSGTVPTGLTFTINGNQLAIAGTPTVSGTVTFDVTATDSIGGSTTLNYTLTINPPVSLSTTSVAPATVGVGYTQTISASGGTGNLTVTYTVATGAIPTGLTFTTNTNQLVIAGTPTAAGSVSFLVTATDSLGASVTHELTLTVSVPTPPPPPPPPSPPPPSPPSAPQTLSTPPLLGLFDQLLGATETVNADGSVTETAHLFGFPLLVSTFDSSGHLESVILFGINVTALFELL